MEKLAEVIDSIIEREADFSEVRRLELVPELRSIDTKARTIDFVASTETPDRYGDVIRVAGWQTDNYMKNPVFLWGHDSSAPPIGRTISVRKEAGPRPALIQTVEFVPGSTDPFAEQIFNLYRDGFMKAVSVGFRALERPQPIRDAENERVTGFEFTKQELLELSAVPIPANPEALARALSSGPVELVARAFSKSADADVVDLVKRIEKLEKDTALLMKDRKSVIATAEDFERALFGGKQ